MVDDVDDDDEPTGRKAKHPSRGVSAALGAVQPLPRDQCRRCKKKISDEMTEYCYVCNGPLCTGCWDQYGECGHQGRAA